MHCTKDKFFQCEMIACMSYHCMIIWLVVDFNLKIFFPQKYKIIAPDVVLDKKFDDNLILIPL